jgi:hypothetical protein
VSWKVTVRHGSSVRRKSFEDLDEALEEVDERIREVQLEGGLKEISALRKFTPAQRVHARIEVSGPGFLRGPEAGVDVMGDGAIVPYRGAIRKQRLEATGRESAVRALREALSG